MYFYLLVSVFSIHFSRQIFSPVFLFLFFNYLSTHLFIHLQVDSCTDLFYIDCLSLSLCVGFGYKDISSYCLYYIITISILFHSLSIFLLFLNCKHQTLILVLKLVKTGWGWNILNSISYVGICPLPSLALPFKYIGTCASLFSWHHRMKK